jgi:hypothetical protein
MEWECELILMARIGAGRDKLWTSSSTGQYSCVQDRRYRQCRGDACVRVEARSCGRMRGRLGGEDQAGRGARRGHPERGLLTYMRCAQHEVCVGGSGQSGSEVER